MTNQCVLIDGIIYCQCGDPSSHYGTMGERGAREVRCEVPPREQVPSKEQVERLIRRVNALIPSSVTPATRIEIHPCDWLMLVDAARASNEPPADHRELIARLENISNYEPDEAWDVVVDAMKALRAAQPPAADLLREIRSSHEQLRSQSADRGGVYQKCQCRYCATPTKEADQC